MNWFMWALWVFGPVWVAGFAVALGVLAERERLLNPGAERGAKWLLALVVSAALWFIVLPLWPSSRPVPPQPAEDDGYLGAVSQGVYIPPQGVHAVDRPGSLALCGRIQIGERVWVKSLGLVLTRREMFWFGDCGCRYNFSGFPVVLCRTHRSDVDPQGEPDEGPLGNDEEVGR